MQSLLSILLTCHIVSGLVNPTNSAPVENSESKSAINSQPAGFSRSGKSLQDFYDYVPQGEFDDGGLDGDYGEAFDDRENEVLSRGAYNRRQNSPIYYIRLPPTPYMYVPGLGYVSHPPSVSPLGPTPNSFINLPISFISNGKPANIYQWSGAFPQAPQPVPIPVIPKPKPTPKPDSTVHRLPGRFPFNGKPTDILVLRDSYNSLYADALQNFYP